MSVLEIIRHADTSDVTAGKTVDFGLRKGKTAIVVTDVPGFYVYRCIGPYIAKPLALVIDGVDPEKLDKLMTKRSLPVGPITLADEVGLDVTYNINQTLFKALGVRMEGGDAKRFEEIGQGFLEMVGLSSRNLFLSGATGFLHLLHALINYARCIVYCLVGAADEDAVMDRIKKTLTNFRLLDDAQKLI